MSISVSGKTFRLGLVLSALLFIAGLKPVQAQIREVKNQYGVKVGMNYSGFRRTPDLKFGYQIGVVGKRYLGDLGWFVQPEINYSREGNLNQPLEFINVPIILGFDFSDNFNLNLGFQAGILVGTQGIEGYEYKNVNTVINLGLEFYSFKKTTIGFRFDYGLSDFEESTGISITYTFEVYFIARLRQ